MLEATTKFKGSTGSHHQDPSVHLLLALLPHLVSAGSGVVAVFLVRASGACVAHFYFKLSVKQ